MGARSSRSFGTSSLLEAAALGPVKQITSATTAPGGLRAALWIGWGSQLIQIAAGFVVPRLIADRLGRELLGVWDLAWSLTSYFTLLEAGIGAAVNRHIALHLSERDMTGVNRVVSSVAAAQRVVGTLIVGGSIGLSFFVGTFTPGLSAVDLADAQWLVIILGSSIGISLYGAVYTGVLAGCQKWALHHGIYAFTNTLRAVGMITALSFGKGLVSIALVHLSTEVLGRFIRTVKAHEACPGLSNRLGNATVASIKRMVLYGGKLYLTQVSQVMINQTVNVMISAILGPAFLALYVRPGSLMRQAAVFSQKYSLMLVPRAAVLARHGSRESKASLAIESTRNGLLITLPLTAMLALSGGNLLSVWMGPDFADSVLIAVLAGSFLVEGAYWPLNSVLAGLNYHGRPALAAIMGAAASTVAAGAVLVAGQRELWLVAFAVTLPWSVTQAVYIPIYACARLGVPVRRFILDSWTRPLLCVLPFMACLVISNAVFPDAPLKALLAGGISGGVVLASTYWKWAFPSAARLSGLQADQGDPERAVL
jgi:O-antigen/teichoic acid export membrane protein